ncbi:MAG: cytochrome P460 family protein [Gemmatimonadota bacterium]
MFLAGGFVAFAACADSGETAVDDAADAVEEAADAVEEAVGAAAAAVDTTAEAVWAYMQESAYADWALWPGTGEQYQGGEPHGALLTTYMNDVAAEALEAGAAELPAGAFVVKENFMPDGTLGAVTTMYKTGNNYNPDHNNWWFAKFMPDGTPDQTPDGMAMAGRLGGCQNCHGAAAENDYILTGPLQTASADEGAGGAAGR